MSPFRIILLAAFCLLHMPVAHAEDNPMSGRVEGIVREAIEPLVKEHDIPGMAVAITANGQRYFYNFGVASKRSGRAVSEDTLFEIGSVSKTFTATLGAYAQALGKLSLTDPTSRHMPELAGSSLGDVSLRDLATYTAGGLPLQFPAEVDGPKSMVSYFRNWQPDAPAGTIRRYSNPSIGLFGDIAARSMDKPFDGLMEGTLFPLLGLQHTFMKVPDARVEDYAFGYSKEGKPIRVTPGVLALQAYGVKTGSRDLLRFVEANMDPSALPPEMQTAMAVTHTGYYRVGAMVQGLGWEMYDWPTSVDHLLAGNSTDMALKPQPAEAITPPRVPGADVLLNKTGSTNGFGAYVAMVPARRIGVVMLANRNFPSPARVAAAYRILTALKGATGADAPR